MEDRLNLGSEVRELKLGASFSSAHPKTSTSFHTLKYDFKPASVDLSKDAQLDVGGNNLVTVTVPSVEGSGVPQTVFKGNQRNYAKECVLIIDKKTGQITLEKLHHNIQVKKTRIETAPKPNAKPPHPYQLENSTQRTNSKSKVSTGVRKNAFSIAPRHSPIQSSPSYPHHRSPQQAPAWNANNGQSTLPSIPLIGMDDDIIPTPVPHSQPSSLTNTHMQSSSNNMSNNSASSSAIHSMAHNNNNSSSNNNSNQKTPPMHMQQLPELASSSSSMGHINQTSNDHNIGTSASAAAVNAAHLGHSALSSSESSSDSESSGTGSDSDSTVNSPVKSMSSAGINHIANGTSLPTLLQEDLHLSESNSSDSD